MKRLWLVLTYLQKSHLLLSDLHVDSLRVRPKGRNEVREVIREGRREHPCIRLSKAPKQPARRRRQLGAAQLDGSLDIVPYP